MSGSAQLDFFEQCLVEPGVYRLGQHRPVSIRDQIVRATFVIEQLFRAGQLAASSSVVVTGAGAAGVAAAKKALALGCQKVVLVEKAAQVLSVQAHCKTRWLDPVQYDWPALHCAGAAWPAQAINGPGGAPSAPGKRMPAGMFVSPLPVLYAAEASNWAAVFQDQVDLAQLAAQFEFWHQSQVVSYARQPGGLTWQVHARDGRAGGTPLDVTLSDVDVLLLATGFGPERVDMPLNGSGQYVGKRFWEDDQFQSADFGLGALSGPGRVLVSGSGDGALQDFIRLFTGKASAIEVWLAVEAVLAPSGNWLAQFRNLWHWEQNHRRLQLMGAAAPSRCELLDQLHQRFSELVDGVAQDLVAWKRVESALRALIDPNRPIGDLTLLVKCSHFDECYALNRVVTLLLIKFAQRFAGGQQKPLQPVIYNAVVKGVKMRGPVLHAGWGVRVDALLVHNTTCNTSLDDLKHRPVSPIDSVHGVVVRHGIAAPQAHQLSAAGRLEAHWAPAHLP